MRVLIYFLLNVSILVACGQSHYDSKTEFSGKWINDNIGLLTIEEDSILTCKLQKLTDSIGSQVVVLIIDSLDGKIIEEYSTKITESWKIGRTNYNDGILLLLAIKDRKVRIAVGYGLENIIRDEIAAEIIREILIPQFRNKNYYIGISKSVDRISELMYSNHELIGTRPKW